MNIRLSEPGAGVTPGMATGMDVGGGEHPPTSLALKWPPSIIYTCNLKKEPRASTEMVMEAAEEEAAPMELNTINTYGGFLNVFPDKLSMQYTSVHLHGHDVGVVPGNLPAPVKRLLYYFEIYVRNTGAKDQIAIGFTT
ncbi:hypothetical protein U1Q18_031782 [Sarracenia purpurea var. burkii]